MIQYVLIINLKVKFEPNQFPCEQIPHTLNFQIVKHNFKGNCKVNTIIVAQIQVKKIQNTCVRVEEI